MFGGCSSSGRASALHAEGTGFDYLLLHHFLHHNIYFFTLRADLLNATQVQILCVRHLALKGRMLLPRVLLRCIKMLKAGCAGRIVTPPGILLLVIHAASGGRFNIFNRNCLLAGRGRACLVERVLPTQRAHGCQVYAC